MRSIHRTKILADSVMWGLVFGNIFKEWWIGAIFFIFNLILEAVIDTYISRYLPA